MQLTFSTLIIILITFILSLYIFFLLHKGGRKKSNYLLSLFFLSQILGFFPQLYYSHYSYFYQNYPGLFYIGIPSTLLWAPSLFLYVKSMVDPNFWKKKILLIHLLPFILLLLYFIFSYHIYDTDTQRKLLDLGSVYNEKSFQLLGIVIFLQVIGYNIVSLVEIRKYETRLKQNVSVIAPNSFKWLKFIVYAYVITCFINLTLIKMLEWYTTLDHVALSDFLFFIFFTLLFYKALIKPEVFLSQEAKQKYQSSTLDQTMVEPLLTKLDNHVKNKKPFLQPNLTLRELAEELDMNERHLSQIINEYKGQNFYDFINGLRIEEAKKMLSHPNNPYNILQVLYESGFNSKTAFNVTFKKFTGLTPSEYKKNL